MLAEGKYLILPYTKWTSRLLPASSYFITTSRSLLSRPGSAAPPLPIQEAREELKNLVGSAKIFGEKRVITQQAPTNQAALPKRKMLDSYREAVLPLGTYLKLRDKYINFHNKVRFGRVMEDLDTMAVWTSYTHYLDPSNQTGNCPLSIVTAAVDRIDMKASHMVPEKDILLRSHVTYVGSSSLEVSINVEQEDAAGNHQDILEAKFLMVSRDPIKKVKMPVNALSLETPEEKELFIAGKDSKVQRMKEIEYSLLKTYPTEEERAHAHEIFLATVNPKSATFKNPHLPAGSVWLGDTLLKNIHICFPEQRNLYGKIFGGYLMRTAYELGWANAALHGKDRKITIEAVDDILFRRPVEIGSLLFLSSQVVYTEANYIQVRVHAEVVDATTHDHKSTNVFHYTFSVDQPVAPVMPKSYAEYMMYLDGRRHFNESMQHKKK